MKKIIAGAASFLLPAIALAQPTFQYAQGTLAVVRSLVNTATPIVIGLAFLFFLWGLMKFVLAAGNEEAKDEGKRIMIWGIVALFIMVSVWGIVNILQREANVGTGNIPTVPTVP